MKNFIKEKLKEGINQPSFDLPVINDITEEEKNKLRSLTWNSIMVDPKENDGSPMFYMVVSFKDSSLNKFSNSIVFSIQQIKEMYYHPHIFLSDNLQGLGITPKIFKAFIMDFGHLYFTKGRILNNNVNKIIDKIKNDPDVESFSDNKATIIIKKNNPDKNELIKIINI